MEKVAIYIRLSREDIVKIVGGDDSESIKNQKLMLFEYATKKEWQIFDFYVDEDYSGADRNRPDFDRLLKDAENKEFNIVLCKAQNRFVRDLEMVEEIIHRKFLSWGIRFVSILDSADTANENNKKSRQIHGLVDEWYLEDQSKNIRAVFRTKMQAGQFLGSFAPYGYMKDPSDKHKLIIDKEVAPVIKKIFRLYIQGYGTHKIAKQLTGEGIERPSVHMKRKNKNFSLPNVSQYNLWGHTTINRILRNPVYIGTLTQGKETTESYKNKKRISLAEDKWVVIDNNHEPIIDETVFYRVQELLSAKRRNKKIGKKGQTHIFATKVRCMHCGGAMLRSANKRSDGSIYAYLRCKNGALGGDLICTHKTKINYQKLYDHVESEFLRKIIGVYKNDFEAIKETSVLIEEIDSAQEIKKLTRNMQITEADSKRNAKVLTNLYIDKVKGIVTEEDYLTISLSLQKEKEQLELKRKSIKEEIDKIKKLELDKVDKEKIMEMYLKNPKLTHEIVLETINFIEIGAAKYDMKKGREERTINISWKL